MLDATVAGGAAATGAARAACGTAGGALSDGATGAVAGAPQPARATHSAREGAKVDAKRMNRSMAVTLLFWETGRVRLAGAGVRLVRCVRAR